MYAIVEIAGQQFKVENNQRLYVHNLNKEVGESITFEKVLLIDNEGAVTVGMPTVAGSSVAVKVLANVKGDKVLVFKKKRRKGYQKCNGHRQQFTQIQVENIAC